MTIYALARDVVRVSGPDAEGFLQGQVSQDVKALAIGESAWTFVLQPTGKVEVLARVWRQAADCFVFDTDAGWGERLVARLNRFKLRTKADIEALDWGVIAARGVVGERPAGALVAWPGADGYDVVGPDLPSVDGDAADLHHERVALGWPAMGTELDETTIPGEAGIVAHTVSFSKGCYTGQELVARVDSRGNNVPRHLRVVRGATAPGDVLLDDGDEVGRVTSVSGELALAYIARRVELPATLTTSAGDPVDVG